MTEPSPLSPEILPPQETPEMYGPIAENTRGPVSTKPTPSDIIKKFTPFIVIFFILLIVLVVSSMASKASPSNPNVVTLSPTPTTEVRSISSRTLNSFATESAFLQFETTIESLPKVIQGAVLQDPTALPPVLDLKLGFSN